MLFNSWFYLIGGFFPFPGARLVLWIMFFNLSAVTLFRFSYNWKKLGVLVLHLGMILLVVSSGVTFHFAQESQMTLKEGETSNVTADYHNWELAVWNRSASGDTVWKSVEAVDVDKGVEGSVLLFEDKSISVFVNRYFVNAQGLVGVGKKRNFINASNIRSLVPVAPSIEPAENFAGIEFVATYKGDSESEKKILLYGAESKPTPIVWEGTAYYFDLRRIRYPIPITIGLNDFVKKDHPGTQIPSSFESFITVTLPRLARDVVVSMNKPFRHLDYTFFQASFAQENNEEYSTFAVVKNPGRVLPYIACLIIGLGMLLHFCIMLVRYALKQSALFSKEEKNA
jgi:hypothetical protein